jgi:hypothetical protein
MRALLALGFGILAIAAGQHPDPPVGWRFDVASDSSRQYEPDAGDSSGSGPRPVAISVFYPSAAASAAVPASLETLARLDAYGRFRRPPETASAAAATAAFAGAAPGASARVTQSVRDAEPAPGRHPVVLLAHSTPLGMSAMAEDLAAHGFVVAGVISRGAERGAYRLSVADVQAMTADLRFALDRVRELPGVDASRVGVIGMSNGALAAVGLANLIPIDAIVSLDGTVGERAAARVLPELPAAATPATVPPLLHLYAPENSFLDFAELRKRPGRCLTIRVPDVAHSDFLTFALLRPVDPAASPRRDRVTEKFGAMRRLTRAFLASHLSAGPDVGLGPGDESLGLSAAPCDAR